MTTVLQLQRQLRDDGTLTLVIRARPGAARSMIKGVMSDGTLKIDIAAAPEDGKANAELVCFLAETFKIPRENVALLSGEVHRRKTVRVTL